MVIWLFAPTYTHSAWVVIIWEQLAQKSGSMEYNFPINVRSHEQQLSADRIKVCMYYVYIICMYVDVVNLLDSYT